MNFPCRGDLELRFRDLRTSLSIWGRYERVERFLGVVCKLLLCRDTCGEYVNDCGTQCTQLLVRSSICWYDHPSVGMQMTRCESSVGHIHELLDRSSS